MTRPCVQIDSVLHKAYTLQLYPGCAPFYTGENPQQQVAVEANYFSKTDPFGPAVSIAEFFGTGGWLALWIHVIAVEFYLRLTPAESQRLRQVSYERQLERGFKNPGSAGLTAYRFGDANPYKPIPKSSETDSEMLPQNGKKAVDEEHDH